MFFQHAPAKFNESKNKISIYSDTTLRHMSSDPSTFEQALTSISATFHPSHMCALQLADVDELKDDANGTRLPYIIPVLCLNKDGERVPHSKFVATMDFMDKFIHDTLVACMNGPRVDAGEEEIKNKLSLHNILRFLEDESGSSSAYWMEDVIGINMDQVLSGDELKGCSLYANDWTVEREGKKIKVVMMTKGPTVPGLVPDTQDVDTTGEKN